MQTYTGDPQFKASLVPYGMGQGRADGTEGGHTAPGSRPSSLPSATDRTSGSGGPPWPDLTGLPRVNINDPIRAGEASGADPDGFEAGVWDDAGGPDGGGPWTEPPPGVHDVDASWVQRP